MAAGAVKGRGAGRLITGWARAEESRPRPLSSRRYDRLDSSGIHLGPAVERREAVDLLLHVRELRVAVASEGGVGLDRLDQSLEPRDERLGGGLDARVTPLVRGSGRAEPEGDPPELGHEERRPAVRGAVDEGLPPVARDGVARFPQPLVLRR